MTSHTVRSRLWHARAAVLLALISALFFVLLVSDGRLASAQTPPQVDPWAWGRNSQGQLGYDPDPATTDTFENSSTPGQVSGLMDVVAIAAGSNHNLAVKSDGTVWAWGFNSQGMLGNGSSGTGTDSNVPVQVSNLTDATDVSGGNFHSIALKSDGTV
jgi:alpha-tubulin suppressor-like RCC1 family protein